MHHNPAITQLSSIGFERSTSIRAEYWERQFPGCSDDILTHFGELTPPPGRVSRWKSDWLLTTPYRFLLDNLSDISPSIVNLWVDKTATTSGIHPYFYDFWVERKEIHGEDPTYHMSYIATVPFVAFYKEEHLVMFKLTWQH